MAPSAGVRVAAAGRPLLRGPRAVGAHAGRHPLRLRRADAPEHRPDLATRTTWSATSSRGAGARCWTPRWTRAASCARATRSGARRCRYASSRSRCAARAGCSGVIARNTNLLTVRTPSRLELTYLQSASDLAQMIAAGTFPFPGRPGRHGRLAAGRRRPDPAGRGRPGAVRQPQRAVRLPPARPGHRPGRPAPGPDHRRTRARPAARWTRRWSSSPAAGPRAADRGRGRRRRRAAARHPAQAQGRHASARSSCCATSPNCAAASGS